MHRGVATLLKDYSLCVVRLVDHQPQEELPGCSDGDAPVADSKTIAE
jgi:hypothetical protein